MPAPKERLQHLLDLASGGEQARTKLARELSEVLLDWPKEYSAATRVTFEALLEKTMRDVDDGTRADVASRFARRTDVQVELLNKLYFAASAGAKDEILSRNAAAPDLCYNRFCFDEEALLRLARQEPANFSTLFATAIRVPDETAREILRDSSAQSLAIACKGAHAERATFSALAVLSDRSRSAEDSYLRLASYDAVPQGAAERLLDFWRNQAVKDKKVVATAGQMRA